MNINTVLPTITTFAELRPIAEQADVGLTFWGYRYVVVNGYEGSLPLDALAAHTLKMIYQERPNLNEEERLHGEFIERRINYIYEKSDELVSERNYFTQFLVFARAFFSSLYTFFYLQTYTTRYDWKGGPLAPIGSHFLKKPIPPEQTRSPLITIH